MRARTARRPHAAPIDNFEINVFNKTLIRTRRPLFPVDRRWKNSKTFIVASCSGGRARLTVAAGYLGFKFA